MRRLGRRSFVKSSAVLAAAGGLPFAYAPRSFAAGRPPLVPDPNGELDLAEGFSYRVLDRFGDPMSDGYRVPGLPDGTGCFPLGDGTLALMRNHELALAADLGPYPKEQAAPPETYDASMHGGVTRLVVDATSFERVSSNLVLVGTTRNCAGGKSPWGWLTCEESVDARHGYVFACSPRAEHVMAPVRLPFYGHMYHEAAVVDPRTYAGYLTEDRADGCLYRFLPDDPEVPFVGRFQALAIAGAPGFETTRGLTPGQELDVTWVDLPSPDPFDDTLRVTARALGAAVVCRGEGIWHQSGTIFFTATSGGAAGCGQIFALRPTRDGGTLVLVAESTGREMMTGPDSIIVAPWGDVLVTEDDVTGTTSNNRLLGITPEGEMYTLAQTPHGELSGLCFSPDGRALFLSVFHSHVTTVVTGPFPDPIPMTPDPEEPSGYGGEGGAGPGPEIPVVSNRPAPRPAARIRPARGCAVSEPGASPDSALAVAVALGTAALAAGRRGPGPR